MGFNPHEKFGYNPPECLAAIRSTATTPGLFLSSIRKFYVALPQAGLRPETPPRDIYAKNALGFTALLVKAGTPMIQHLRSVPLLMQGTALRDASLS